MKYLNVSVIILSISLIASCGRKTEQPETVPDVKPVVEKPYTVPVNTDNLPRRLAEEPAAPLPEGFDVTVLDADTGLPVTNASVRYKWHINWIPYTLDALNIGDGVYRICTNRQLYIYYVGVMAKGYIPDNLEKPPFPLTVKLSCGDTVKMSGFIYDSDGNTVSGAYIAIRPLPESNWPDDQWRWIYSCETYSDAIGRYEIATVPTGLENLFPRFCHESLPMKDLTNIVIDTCHGDISQDIYLPEYQIYSGYVRFDTEEPVEGVMVWLLKTNSDMVDSIITRSKYSPYNSVRGAKTFSDSNGYFRIKTFADSAYITVKGYKEGWPPAWAGIFSKEKPVPETIDLVIPTEGSRICGRMSDMQGQPVTNASIKYLLIRQNMYGSLDPMAIEIETDGSYISEILYPGQYDCVCSAPGYRQSNHAITVRKDEVVMYDIVFDSLPTITGRVIDIDTRQPIPGVSLSAQSARAGMESYYSPETDQNGMFWMKLEEYMTVIFSHPAYASNLWRFSARSSATNAIIEIVMSASTSVNVYVDDVPSTFTEPLAVTLAYLPGQAEGFEERSQAIKNYFYTVKDVVSNQALFTDVPVMYSPVQATLIFRNSYTPLTVSESCSLQKGVPAEIHLGVPPFGSLAVTLAHPFDGKNHDLYGMPYQNRRYTINPGQGCEITGSKLFWNFVPTNTYMIFFKTGGKDVLRTNVVIQANQTKTLYIDFATNLNFGVIKGTVKLKSGYPVRCRVSAQDAQKTNSRYVEARDGVFSIERLNAQSEYTVTAGLRQFIKTNIVVEHVKPNGPPLEIIAGEGYKVTGAVVDKDGKPLRFRFAGDNSADIFSMMNNRDTSGSPGEFVLFPVSPGKHSLIIEAEGYAPLHKEISVGYADTDLGEIVMLDSGCGIAGSIVDADGNPLPYIRVNVNNRQQEYSQNGMSDKDGKFSFEHLPRDVPLDITFFNQRQINRKQIPPLSNDEDLGEIEVEFLTEAED